MEPYDIDERILERAVNGLCDMTMTASVRWDFLARTRIHMASIFFCLHALVAWMTSSHVAGATSLPSAAWRTLWSIMLAECAIVRRDLLLY